MAHRSLLAPYCLDPASLMDSAKLRLLEELLPRLRAKGSRCLIFRYGWPWYVYC